MNEKTVSFLITPEEKKTLESIVMFEPFLQDNIRRSRKEGKKVRIKFDAFDLFDAISAVKYFGKHMAPSVERQRCRDLTEKMSRYLTLVRESGQRLGA